MGTLRRLPWTDEGRPAYVTAGDGPVNAVADALEAEMIVTAKADVSRARALVDDPAASSAELRRAVQYLTRAVEDVALVASLRGERLDSINGLPVDQPLWGEDAARVGQALRALRSDGQR